MNDVRLKQLLQAADAGDKSPLGGGDDFGERIIAIARRRSRMRQSVVGAVAILLIAMLMMPRVYQKSPAPLAVAPARDVAGELAALDADAAVAERTVQRMMQDERAVARTASRREPSDVLGAIALERERAAMLLIAQGDWQTSRDAVAARNEYRRARELFPDTYAANLAKDRLERISSRKDG